MSISYPVSWPSITPRPKSVNFRQKKAVGNAEAPGSLVAQTYEWPAERWEVDITWPLMNRANGEAWVAFLDSLRGQVGSFLFGDTAHTSPRGSASSGTVSGAAQARTLTSSGSGTLKAGDWLQITEGGKQRLHKVLVDTTLGSSIEIWPALRATVSSASLTLASPRGQFQLSQTAEHLVDTAGNYQIAATTAVEDLRP